MRVLLAPKDSGWEELNGPFSYYDVLTFEFPILPRGVIVNWRKAQKTRRAPGQNQENIQIEGCRRLSVKRRTNCSAYGIFRNDAVGLHLIDEPYRFLERHFTSIALFRRFAKCRQGAALLIWLQER